MTLTQARTNPFDLEVFLSGSNEELPEGHLFWDNGVSKLQNKQYTYMKFFVQPLQCGSGWGIFNKIVQKIYDKVIKLEISNSRKNKVIEICESPRQKGEIAEKIIKWKQFLLD